MLDISLAQWLDEHEAQEGASVDAEITNQRIAKVTGRKCLKTAALDWDSIYVSASPPGALTAINARETLTAPAYRKRWARQKALRTGNSALVRALRVA